MYFGRMLKSRREILDEFSRPELTVHPRYPECDTFALLVEHPPGAIRLGLPTLSVEVAAVDYLRGRAASPASAPLRFQQDHYRLWYQFDGTGVLQDMTARAFGRASPGLLGVMNMGQRHSYLHQRGTFECLLVDFSLQPSAASHCYWNSDIEGKCLLDEHERAWFDNHAFEILRLAIGRGHTSHLRMAGHLSELIAILFDKGLLVIEDEHFPKDKQGSLVKLAKRHMDTQYAQLRHQDLLSRECGVDINYLNILFKRETGITLYQYLTRVRMEHAKHHLEQAAMPVVDIANRVGYPNSNSFSRAFKRHTGLSPRQYARQHSTPSERPQRAPTHSNTH